MLAGRGAGSWRLAMKGHIFRFAADESGSTAIEYGLIVSLVAVAIIGVLSTLGVNLMNKLNDVVEAFVAAGT